MDRRPLCDQVRGRFGETRVSKAFGEDIEGHSLEMYVSPLGLKPIFSHLDRQANESNCHVLRATFADTMHHDSIPIV